MNEDDLIEREPRKIYSPVVFHSIRCVCALCLRSDSEVCDFTSSTEYIIPVEFVREP